VLRIVAVAGGVALGGLMMFGVMGFIVGAHPGGALRHGVGPVCHGVRRLHRRACAAYGARRGRLVRIGPRLSGHPPHLLERLHVFQRGLQRLGGRLHRFHQRLASRLTGYTRLFAIDSCCLGSFPHALPLLTRRLERLALAVANLTRFLCQLPESLGLAAC
jgi:hypothetical protein